MAGSTVSNSAHGGIWRKKGPPRQSSLYLVVSYRVMRSPCPLCGQSVPICPFKIIPPIWISMSELRERVIIIKMPQEFHVLRCFSCETFQVHIVKKVRKWECKMCGTKQSLKRNYGRGTAKDCRNHVMKLNELRLTKESSSGQNEDEIFEGHSINSLEELQVKEVKEGKEAVKSKWDEYLEDNTNESKSDTDDAVSDFFLATEKKKKRNKKSPKEYYPKSKKICVGSSVNEVFSEPNKESIPLFSSVEEKFNNEKSTVKIDNKLQKSKYAKYVDEEEIEDKLVEENECLNIFESEPTDLDNLLNFE